MAHNHDHDADMHDAFDENNRAYEAHQRRLTASGMLGGTSVAKCALSPGTDSISVRRTGPKGVPSTLVSVAMMTAQGGGSVLLTAKDARRIGMALIDGADEADGMAHLAFTVESNFDKGAE